MLTGKTAIITGANRGIGLETVEVFAEHKAVIWACARTQSDAFEDKIAEIAKRNATIISPVYFDVTDKAAVKSAVNMMGKNTKPIDILVNNAGIDAQALFRMTSLETVQESLNVNFLSQVYLAQQVSRYMIKAKRGSIINMASVSGIVNSQGDIAYGSSKAASIFSTKTMALELGSYGIRVNSVSPGFIATDMWKDRKAEVYDKVLSETPLGRQGIPREVANAILFLASDMSSYITGQNIVVDGGRMSGRV
ncbi:MAG: SDR family oxidoreductase [Lachnospiraceae bacterium]|jgi:3-oxoacyl-[acyl-carrier protein] reductase|nr:SDR family oxidoreductase [Lachnospiraceae bacterium]